VSAPTRVALVEQYLAHRRSLGFALHIEGAQLLSFARFADALAPPGPLTTDLAVRWATQPSARPRRFPGRRLDTIRPFAVYCAAFDPATEVPPLAEGLRSSSDCIDVLGNVHTCVDGFCRPTNGAVGTPSPGNDNAGPEGDDAGGDSQVADNLNDTKDPTISMGYWVAKEKFGEHDYGVLGIPE
jgi:hypothetical protein